MKIERTRNAARNIVFGTILKIYQLIVPFLIRTAMIYFMGVKYLGLNSLFSSLLSVLNLAELGVGSAMVFSMYKPIAEDDSVTICALMKLYKIYYRVIGAVIAVLGIIITPFVPYLIKGDVPSDINLYALYLLNLAATVLSYWLFAYKNSILQAHQRNDVISKVSMITSTVQYALQLLELCLVRNYYIYIIVALLIQIMTNIIIAIASDRIYPDYRAEGDLPKEKVREINKRIRDLFTAKFGTVVMTSVDTIVISVFLGLTELAVYQNYFFVMNSVYGIILIFFSSVLAGIGNSLIKESTDKNYTDLKKFTFIVSWLICVCCCCFLCLYQPFMELWVGKEYMLTYNYVILFGVYFYVCVLSMIWATVKDAAGLWHSDRFRMLIGACANLIMNIIMVISIGLYGVLLSTIFSYVLISMPWLLHNIFRLVYKRSAKEYLIRLGEYLAVTVFCCGLCVFLCSLIKVGLIMQLVIDLLICIIISNCIQFLLFRNSEEYKGSKEMVLKLIKNRGN